jgi:hypothetical protein
MLAESRAAGSWTTGPSAAPRENTRQDDMTNATHGTEPTPHGLFYMENAGGCHDAPAIAPTDAEEATAPMEEHQPSCFAQEEERGQDWHGAGASGPAVKETRPTL